jgi:hypothetical protein
MVDATTAATGARVVRLEFLLKFVPFGVAGIIHLITLFISWDEGSTASKLALMPTLLLAWFALVYAAWWFALVILLAPHIGSLLVPVSAYGLVLALASAAALGAGRTAAIGALLFLVSDTLLAFRLFQPDFEFWQMNFTIMLFYVAGQGLIIAAAALHARAVHAGAVDGATVETGPVQAAGLSPASTPPSTRHE